MRPCMVLSGACLCASVAASAAVVVYRPYAGPLVSFLTALILMVAAEPRSLQSFVRFQGWMRYAMAFLGVVCVLTTPFAALTFTCGLAGPFKVLALLSTITLFLASGVVWNHVVGFVSEISMLLCMRMKRHDAI